MGSVGLRSELFTGQVSSSTAALAKKDFLHLTFCPEVLFCWNRFGSALSLNNGLFTFYYIFYCFFYYHPAQHEQREKQTLCILPSVVICFEITKLERNEAVAPALKSSQPFHPHHITLNLSVIKFNRNQPLAKK